MQFSITTLTIITCAALVNAAPATAKPIRDAAPILSNLKSAARSLEAKSKLSFNPLFRQNHLVSLTTSTLFPALRLVFALVQSNE